MPDALTINGTALKVEPGSYVEEEAYPAETGRVLDGRAVSPVISARYYRRTVSFQTPWGERAVALADRDTLETIPVILGGELLQGTFVGVPVSVQLLNHPERTEYAAVSATLAVDTITEVP